MDYIAQRRAEWEELASLLKRARRWRGISRLNAAELLRLDYLYRRVTVDLAQVSTRTTDAALRYYLNDLAAAAHSIIYMPSRRPWGQNIALFLADVFPRCLAAHWRAHLLSLLVMIGGMFCAWEMIERDPRVAYTLSFDKTLTGNTSERSPGAARETLAAHLRMGQGVSGGKKTFFAAFLFLNNFRVAAMALMAGILAGVPTVLLIFYNGLLLGSFIHMYHAAGIYAEVWAWLLPHGITELGAIILCGGIGLSLGWAVIAPGFLSRREALRACGRDAVRCLGGVFFMIFFASLVESFLRQSYLTTELRLIFAGGTFLLLAGLVIRGFYLRRRDVLENISGN